MVIDARRTDSRELLLQLRSILSDYCGRDVFIDIQMNTLAEAKRARGFASMSGCSIAIEEKEGYFLVQIRGNVCCV